MKEAEVKIVNRLGVHARPSATLTQTASRFRSAVWFTNAKGRRVNGKSIMGVMMLAAGMGTAVTLQTSGEREQEAMQALLALIEDKFGEGE